MDKGVQIVLCMILWYAITEVDADASCLRRCRMQSPEGPCPDTRFACKNDRKGIPRCFQIGCYTAFDTTECREPVRKDPVYLDYYHYYYGLLIDYYDYDYTNVFVKDGFLKDGNRGKCFCDPRCVAFGDCCYDSDCIKQ